MVCSCGSLCACDFGKSFASSIFLQWFVRAVLRAIRFLVEIVCMRNEGTNERTNERKNNEQPNERKKARTNERTKERKKERTNERKNELGQPANYLHGLVRRLPLSAPRRQSKHFPFRQPANYIHGLASKPITFMDSSDDSPDDSRSLSLPDSQRITFTDTPDDSPLWGS